MADPGFFAKNYMKMKEFGLPGVINRTSVNLDVSGNPPQHHSEPRKTVQK